MASPTTTNLDAELRLYPKLTRFYGIGPSELAHTPRWLVRLYAEMMDGIEAEEQLAAITAASSPYMEKADGEAMMNDLRSSARKMRRRLAGLGEYETEEERDARIEADRERRREQNIDGGRLAAMGIAVVKEPGKQSA